MKSLATLRILVAALATSLLITACDREPEAVVDTAAGYDIIIRGGTLYDGSGQPGRQADLAINGDRIAAIGDLSGSQGQTGGRRRGTSRRPGFHQYVELGGGLTDRGWNGSE